MAKKFKDYYGIDTAELIADKILSVYPDFDKKGFLKKLAADLLEKEFHQRQDAYVDAFREFLPPYSKAIAIFSKILGSELTTDTGMFIHGWWLWPIGRYVERYGTEDIKKSLAFIYELTKRFTGEFAIRPIIEKDPKYVLPIIKQWSLDPNVHVRRLSSEGLRPKLPWAKKSDLAISHFADYKEILTNLRSAPEKFVQKSVGNNLNDLMKIDKEKALLIIKDWKRMNPNKETLWIIKHGLRSVKS
jgi:3-methyladenine DNA glycosylase AlkC